MSDELSSLLAAPEGQLLARRGAGIDPRDLANLLIAFANADGGIVLLGAEGSTVEGFGPFPGQADSLLPSALELCRPPVRVRSRWIPCRDDQGREDRVLVLDVATGERVHANGRDEVYLREGDSIRGLEFEERLALVYDRGEASFELSEVEQATLDDLNDDLLARYAARLGSGLEPAELLAARGLARWQGDTLRLNSAGVLLFAQSPQSYLPRPGLRILRYEGTEAQTGTRMNLVKDLTLELPLPLLLEEAEAAVASQLRDFTRLGAAGLFETVPEYPPFAWQEAVVNAVCHRAYNLSGRQVELRIFDDRMEVESPGRLPGPVRLANLRQTHYSRNPRIARVLAEMGFVRELGEGVDRMMDEMAAFGLEPPRFEEGDHSLLVTLRNGAAGRQLPPPPSAKPAPPSRLNERQKRALEYMRLTGEITAQQYLEINPGIDVRTARRDLSQLVVTGHLISLGSTKARSYLLREFRSEDS